MRVPLTMIACLLLVACRGNTSSQDTEPQDEKPAIPKHKSVISLNETGYPSTLDPHTAGQANSSRHVMHVYETLYEYDPFDAAGLIPCLAKSLPEYDKAIRTCTIKLRNDVYFHDAECFEDGKGRKMVAGDVIWSIKRLAAMPYGGYWALEGKIEGLDEFREDALQLIVEDANGRYLYPKQWHEHLEADVSGLQAVDETTVRITLTERFPQLLHALTLPYGAVLAREAVRELSMEHQPVGTGPYLLKERNEDGLVYVRNPSYRDVILRNLPDGHALSAYAGASLPLTHELRYVVQWEAEDEAAKFLKKEVPIFKPGTSQLERFIDMEALKKGLQGNGLLKQEWRDKGVHLDSYDAPVLHYIAFNMDDDVVGTPAGEKGKAIRKALALAIDRQSYIRDRMQGMGTPADQLVPNTVFPHGDLNHMDSQRFDPEAGRKLLKDVGFRVVEVDDAWIAAYPDTGKQITVTISLRGMDEKFKLYAQDLEAWAGEVGIELRCDLLTFAEFLRQQRKAKGQAYDAGWILDYPDAQNIMQLLYGPNKPPGINSATFDHEEYNRCYEEMSVLDEQNEKQRARKKELIAQMHDILDDECPWILMEFRREFELYRGGFHRPQPDPFAYNHPKYYAWGEE